MAVTAIGRTPAPVIPFEPATWLARFRDVGGWWIVGADSQPFMGWMIEGYTEDQNDAARALWHEVRHDQHKLAAIDGHHLANGGEVL